LLLKNNFDVRPILSPTVPKGMERLRICIHAYNTTTEINNLVKCITEAF
ncbi:MAG: 8-amino-7-oxononanoate synthase, partial [Bacteroidia bacterium]